MQSIWNWEHKVHEYDDDLGANAGQNLPATEERWAVVISPSTKWTNYRHQADALAIYQELRHYGYDDDHIVLIVEDNLADVTLRDLYYSLARTTSGSHVSLYNIENYGSVYTNDLSDYIVTSK